MNQKILHIPNLLNNKTLQKLHSDLEKYNENVIVLKGENENFCEGLDLQNLLNLSIKQVEENCSMFSEILYSLIMCPKPTIAFVNGKAIGGGVGIAAACDFVIADETARFFLPELLYGLFPGLILPALSKRMSKKNISRLCLFGEPMDVKEALHLELVDEYKSSTDINKVLKKQIKLFSRFSKESMITFRNAFTNSLGCLSNLKTWKKESLSKLTSPEIRKKLLIFLEEGTVPWEVF